MLDGRSWFPAAKRYASAIECPCTNCRYNVNGINKNNRMPNAHTASSTATRLTPTSGCHTNQPRTHVACDLLKYGTSSAALKSFTTAYRLSATNVGSVSTSDPHIPTHLIIGTPSMSVFNFVPYVRMNELCVSRTRRTTLLQSLAVKLLCGGGVQLDRDQACAEQRCQREPKQK